MTLAEQQYFRKLGFATFPLVGKIPTVTAWDTLTVDNCPPIREGNYGVKLPPGIMVVDADPRNYRVLSDTRERDNPMVRLATDIGGFPETLTVFTGGGGIHKFFRIPPMDVAKHQHTYPGLDFLGSKCYVVGAGSIHPETQQPYTFFGECRKITEAPDDLVTLVATRSVTPTDLSPDDFPNHPASIEKYKQELAAFPVAIQGQHGDEQTYKAAVLGHNLGLLPETTLECMLTVYNPRCLPPWDDCELRTKIDNAYRYARRAAGTLYCPPPWYELDENHAEEIKKAIQDWNPDYRLRINDRGGIDTKRYNITYFLKVPFKTSVTENDVYRLFKYNELTEEIEFAYNPPWASQFADESRIGQPYTDNDIMELYLHFKQRWNAEFKLEDIEKAIENAGRKVPYNPIKKYLRSLKWDGVSRLNTWLHKYCGADDTEFNSLVGEIIFLGAVNRAFDAGCKWQYLPIIESAQGETKSTFVKMLAHDDRFYSSISLNLEKENDIYMKLKGKWIVEVSELSGHHRSDVNAIKKFLSDDVGRIRIPYAKRATDFFKPGILVGTYNPGHGGYLKDLTGNRRFLPVNIKRMPEGKKARDLIDKLYAEAVHLYMNGRLDETKVNHFPWKQMEHLGDIETAQRTVSDVWAQDINQWIMEKEDHETFTERQIATQCLNIDSTALTRKHMDRIGKALQYLKLPHKMVTINGLLTRVYYKGGEGYLGEDGRAFKEALQKFTGSCLPVRSFVEDLMGMEATVKRLQQVGMWLKSEGHTTERIKDHATGRVVSWVFNKDGGEGL